MIIGSQISRIRKLSNVLKSTWRGGKSNIFWLSLVWEGLLDFSSFPLFIVWFVVFGLIVEKSIPKEPRSYSLFWFSLIVGLFLLSLLDLKILKLPKRSLFPWKELASFDSSWKLMDSKFILLTLNGSSIFLLSWNLISFSMFNKLLSLWRFIFSFFKLIYYHSDLLAN